MRRGFCIDFDVISVSIVCYGALLGETGDLRGVDNSFEPANDVYRQAFANKSR